MKFSLAQQGYAVLLAENGQAGLDALFADPEIGLVITDMQMPVMDGAELIGRIRRQSGYADLPLIVLTSDEKKGREAIGLGATAFIVKSAGTSEEIRRFVTTYIKL